MRRSMIGMGSLLLVLGFASMAVGQEYTTYRSWSEVYAGNGAKYPPLVRVSDPGTSTNRVYTGFWFYDKDQFDATGRYALGMKVYFQNREVTKTDVADIGYFDLQNGNRWTKIGTTTAWNWQQGCQLQWRPRSDEILWNDRAPDNSHFITQAYNFRTGARRTLPRPIRNLSSDGVTAISIDYQRILHPGCNYVGIPDPYAGQKAPAGTGLWKMDLNTGASQLLMSLQRMAQIEFPSGYTGSSNLYFFGVEFNPSGTRLGSSLNVGLGTPIRTMSAAGTDIRLLSRVGSHSAWLDNQTWVRGEGLTFYKDDGSGKSDSWFPDLPDLDARFVPGPGGDWFLGDSYPQANGYQYVVLIHLPTRLFVPLARLRNTALSGIHRIDCHARASRNGRIVSIDSSYEGMGRQMYVIDIGHILDNPPGQTGIIGTGTGLSGQYFDNKDFTAPKLVRTDPTVGFTWGTGSPDPSIAADTFSARWTGQVQAQHSQVYTFTTESDDGVRLWVNGQLLVDNWTDHPLTANSGSIALTAGQKVSLKMEYYENGGGATARLLWSSPSTPKQVIPKSQLYPAAVTQPPTVTGLVLINVDTLQPVAGYNPIPEGATLNLATLPPHLNIEARTSGVESVRFGYDGDANYKLETNPPFALAGASTTAWALWTPTNGAHTITATPFSGDNATGTAGATLTRHITVTNAP